MRPIYETPETLKNEREVADFLSGIWGCEFVKLKISYGLDFGIMKDGDLVATAEIKCRNYDSATIDALGGLMLSASKAHRAADWHVPFVLAVRLTDGLFTASIQDWSSYRIEITGRRDRGDWQDIEPCFIIPMDQFNKVENDQTS
jgi:hypothetical protein